MAKGPRCGIYNCPSRKYHEQDGHQFCSRGHDHGVIAVHAGEDDYAASKGRRETTRIRPETLPQKKTRVLEGKEALHLFLLCYQELLCNQCQALRGSKELPDDVEPLARDLWALRLPLIEEKLGARLSRGEGIIDDEETLEGPKLYSSQAESTAGETDVEGLPKREIRRQLPNLIDSLALCYMAMILLRCPISTGEVHRWAVQEDVAFIRPLRMVPQDVRRNLSTRWKNLLETHHALKPDHLNNSLRRLISQYSRHFNLILPELNYPPLLYWYINELSLHVQLFSIVEHLAAYTSTSFAFPTHTDYRRKHRSPKLPELRLVSLLIVAVKLFHPFDTKTYYSHSVTDPAFLRIDWAVWSAARQCRHERLTANKPFAPGDQMYVSEKDVFNLSDAQLDSYMDWFEATWTDTPQTEKCILPQEIVDMFEPGHPPELGLVPSTRSTDDDRTKMEADNEALEKAVKRMKGTQIVSEEQEKEGRMRLSRVGFRYPVFREESDLRGVAKEFHEAVAERAATTVNTLLKGVLEVETDINKARRRERSKKKADVDIDVGLDAMDIST